METKENSSWILDTKYVYRNQLTSLLHRKQKFKTYDKIPIKDKHL